MSKLWIEPNNLIKLVDHKVKMTDILNKTGHGQYSVGQPCFCPFHDNTNTPAAVIYDNDGKQTLYCFSERRLYTPSDLIKTVVKKDVYQLGSILWDRLSEYEQSEFLESLGQLESTAESFNLAPTDEKSIRFAKVLQLFKYGKIDYSALMKEYIKTLIE